MNKKPNATHLFLSYSRDDAMVMLRIRRELERNQIQVWTDEGLVPGTESWKRDIENAISNALGIVVILSPSAKQSMWVERELGFARAHGIRVFPILVQGDPSNAIPIELINAQFIDLRTGTDFSTQVKSLIRALKEQPGERRGYVQDQAPSAPPYKRASTTLTTKIVVIAAVIIGLCLVGAVTFGSIFGPEFIAYLRGGSPSPVPPGITPSTSQPITPTELPVQNTPPTPTELPAQNMPPTSTSTSASKAEPQDIPKTVTPSATINPPTLTPTFTRTPQLGFEDCIYSSAWTVSPSNASVTSDGSGCLVASNLGFSVQNQGLLIRAQNPNTDVRYGLYTPIQGDVLITLDARVDQLETGFDDRLGSLGFGIMSLNPTNTETDGFIYYVIESPAAGYPVFLKKKERGGFEQYIQLNGDYYRYPLGTKQQLALLIEGSRLRITIDGVLVRDTNLSFNDRAFFIGYKFEDIGTLQAQISNFMIQKR